jgi:vacuolar protein sorting-associated protein 53
VPASAARAPECGAAGAARRTTRGASTSPPPFPPPSPTPARSLDESILETVREQSTAGAAAARDIADAKDSIGDLHAKIVEIKKKAEASEQMVVDICKDIKQLDVAKRHLTNTILTLARLKTLTSAVQQLQGHAGRRSYEEAAPLLEAAIQLFTHFADYAKVPKVSELAGAVESVRGELREMITEDFDILLDTATPSDMSFQDAQRASAAAAAGNGMPEERVLSLDELKGGGGGRDEDGGPRVLSEDNIQTLRAACECVDALGPTVRKSVLKSFNRKQLKNYTRIFARGTDAGDSLDGIDKRYAWFRKSVGLIEDKYGRILPKRWRVLHRLSIEFCEATRTDVERILQQFDPPSSAPPEILLRALLKSIAFEKEMSKKFESDLAKDGGGDGGSGGSGGGGGAGGEEDEPDEVWDENAPLYNDKGELVDPTCAEGIRLKYRRKNEFKERQAKELERKAARAEQRRVIASLAGVDTRDAAAASASGKPVGIGRATLDDEIASLPKIAAPGEGMISSVFKPYMTSYVKFERTNIDNAVSATAAEDAGNKTDSAAAHASVLRSATQLFAQARNAITRCVQLSTGQTLFDLYKEIADSMAAYAAGLQSRMPSPAQPSAASLPGDSFTVPDNEAPKAIDAICLIINTSGALGGGGEGRGGKGVSVPFFFCFVLALAPITLIRRHLTLHPHSPTPLPLSRASFFSQSTAPRPSPSSPRAFKRCWTPPTRST